MVHGSLCIERKSAKVLARYAKPEFYRAYGQRGGLTNLRLIDNIIPDFKLTARREIKTTRTCSTTAPPFGDRRRRTRRGGSRCRPWVVPAAARGGWHMTVGVLRAMWVCKERLERTLRKTRGSMSSLRGEQMVDKMAFSKKTRPVVGRGYPARCVGRLSGVGRRASGVGGRRGGGRGKGSYGQRIRHIKREGAPSRKQPPDVVELSRA